MIAASRTVCKRDFERLPDPTMGLEQLGAIDHVAILINTIWDRSPEIDESQVKLLVLDPSVHILGPV